MAFNLFIGQNYVMFVLYGGHCYLAAIVTPNDATWRDVCTYDYNMICTRASQIQHTYCTAAQVAEAEAFTPPPR